MLIDVEPIPLRPPDAKVLPVPVTLPEVEVVPVPEVDVEPLPDIVVAGIDTLPVGSDVLPVPDRLVEPATEPLVPLIDVDPLVAVDVPVLRLPPPRLLDPLSETEPLPLMLIWSAIATPAVKTAAVTPITILRIQIWHPIVVILQFDLMWRPTPGGCASDSLVHGSECERSAPCP